MTDHILVHLNAVRPVGPFSVDLPETRFFFEQLPRVFEDADKDDGMRWHNHGARTHDGRYLSLPEIVSLSTDGTDNPYIVTMAAWSSARDLHRFSHRMANHIEGMKRLRHWVDRSEGATMVMWWDTPGRRVTLEDGWNRLQKLRTDGPTEFAFNMQTRFDAPGHVPDDTLAKGAA
ncbi:MAG: DUF3291 domain-containing protein [Pseudomonadota bacterium]